MPRNLSEIDLHSVFVLGGILSKGLGYVLAIDQNLNCAYGAIGAGVTILVYLSFQRLYPVGVYFKGKAVKEAANVGSESRFLKIIGMNMYEPIANPMRMYAATGRREVYGLSANLHNKRRVPVVSNLSAVTGSRLPLATDTAGE